MCWGNSCLTCWLPDRRLQRLLLNPHAALAHRSVCDFLLPKKQERKRSQCFQEREGAHAHPAQRWVRREHRNTFCSVSSQVAFLTSFCCEAAEPDGCPGTTWIRSRKLRSIRVSKAIFVTRHKRHRRSQLCPVASVGAGGVGHSLKGHFQST